MQGTAHALAHVHVLARQQKKSLVLSLQVPMRLARRLATNRFSVQSVLPLPPPHLLDKQSSGYSKLCNLAASCHLPALDASLVHQWQSGTSSFTHVVNTASDNLEISAESLTSQAFCTVSLSTGHLLLNFVWIVQRSLPVSNDALQASESAKPQH